jgi:hypothetical protein
MKVGLIGMGIDPQLPDNRGERALSIKNFMH